MNLDLTPTFAAAADLPGFEGECGGASWIFEFKRDQRVKK